MLADNFISGENLRIFQERMDDYMLRSSTGPRQHPVGGKVATECSGDIKECELL